MAMQVLSTAEFTQRLLFGAAIVAVAWVMGAASGTNPLLPAVASIALSIALCADLVFGAGPSFRKHVAEFLAYSALANVVMAIEKVF